jgi:lysophospholipase L1-like esterase
VLKLAVLAIAVTAGMLFVRQVHAAAAQLPPVSVEDLNCEKLDFNLANPALIEPGKFDSAQFMKGFTPEMAARLQLSSRIDPNGLCHYRDANRTLSASSSRVVFMGDSITEQWKMGAPDLFTGAVIGRGISGQNTTQMLLRFRQDVLDLDPKVVHIMAGINDINIPSGTTLTKSNIMSMVDLARSHGITVVLGAITPSNHFWLFPDLKPGPQIVALNTWLKDYARRQGVIYVDYYTPLADRSQGLRADLGNEGLHPNRNGYRLMTPLAKAAIARALQSASP